MKKLLSILIAISILLSVCAPLSAYAESTEMKNPLIESDPVKPLTGGNIIFMEDSVSANYKGNTYYTLGRQLYRIVKTKLENRKTRITIHCISKDKVSFNTALKNIIYKCYLGATDDELSVTSTDGDYLRWAVSSLKTVSFSNDAKKNGYYYYTVKTQLVYYDTVAEEKKTDAVVNAYINSLNTNGKSDYQILKEVHDYICNKNKYSYVAADSPSNYPYAFSAYGTLIKGRSVCQGYAAAFYRICKELGYSVRFVSSDPDWGCHAWNIIMLDGKYYIVDCTWDDQTFDEDSSASEPYFYFLTDYENSMKYDSIYGEHKLYSSIYGTNYFENNFKKYFAAKPYKDETGSRLSSCSVSVSSGTYIYNAAENKPSVTVKDGGTLLRNGTDYSVSYSSNINTGIAKVNIQGKGKYTGTSSHRIFRIYPEVVNGLSVKAKSADYVKLVWNSAQGAVTGYQIQYFDGKKWKTAGNTDKNYLKVKNLSPAKKYSFRVRAYKTVNKNSFYGKFGSIKTTATKPKREVISSVTAGKKKFTVNWKKYRASGYQIQYSQKKNMKKPKTVNVKSGRNTKTVKKIKPATYYVRVRAFEKYKDENGKVKYSYGKWSAEKTVKIYS